MFPATTKQISQNVEDVNVLQNTIRHSSTCLQKHRNSDY